MTWFFGVETDRLKTLTLDLSLAHMRVFECIYKEMFSNFYRLLFLSLTLNMILQYFKTILYMISILEYIVCACVMMLWT